ncbi:MAG: IS630 family transposase [bacterium]
MKEKKYSTYEMRIRAVNAIQEGMHVNDVAKAYHVDRSTIYRWVNKKQTSTTNEGLIRKPGSGRPRKLEQLTSEQLQSLVLKPASEFGYETDFWTCKRLRHVIEKEYQISVSKWTMWRRLREADLTYQKPERRYYEADEEEREDWLTNQLPHILAIARKHRAILYFEDESHISLSALLGKTWAPRGKPPTQTGTGHRGGISALSAISKSGNLKFILHQKRITSAEIIHFLDQLLIHHKGRHLVIVMDQAKPHTSKKTQDYIEKQKRLHVFYLPSYSPDWNPDEKVWNHLKNIELRGHQATTEEELIELAETKLTKMAHDTSTVKGIFLRSLVADFLH